MDTIETGDRQPLVLFEDFANEIAVVAEAANGTAFTVIRHFEEPAWETIQQTLKSRHSNYSKSY